MMELEERHEVKWAWRQYPSLGTSTRQQQPFANSDRIERTLYGGKSTVVISEADSG
jgi:hypothetical protein